MLHASVPAAEPFQQVLEQHRPRAGRDVVDRLVVDHVPGRRGLVERVALAPGLAAVEGVQQVDVGLRRAVVEPAAVGDARDVVGASTLKTT